MRPILAYPALLIAFVTVATAAQAQGFRLDLAPSAMRAANAPPKPADPVPGRLNALSPLGGRQGEPVNKPVTSAVTPLQAYAGATTAPTPGDLPGDPRAGVGITSGKLEDSSVEDPNKPRRPLQPNSIKKGVAPRS